MRIDNRYTVLTGIRYPIVQEGLGLSRTARLAAAVSSAGGLGSVSIPGISGDLDAVARGFRAEIERCAALAGAPFAVNIPAGTDADGALLPFTDVLLRTVLEARRSDSAIARLLTVVTTSAGDPRPFVGVVKDAGLVHQHKVGSTRHAERAAAAGVDVLIACGYEAGGHTSAQRMHSFVLMPNIADAVDIPVLLSGGVRDGRGLAAAICLGADGVAMGTRFVATHDNAEWHARFIDAVISMGEGDDIAFSGNYGPCRGRRNEVTELLARSATDGHGDAASISTKLESMRRAQDEGRVEDSIVLAGQVASGITGRVLVADLLQEMVADATRLLGRSIAAA
ncbi:MAG: 2-nitropropane dioxygenase [Pseudonocardia sp. SCN 72-86]|nr:MAG: 2-nitropropane dioxygenase [Pseudonocardia sp. SCN 72-86]